MPVAEQKSAWGFGWGLTAGVVLALLALVTAQPQGPMAPEGTLAPWLTLNLGHSVWLFAIVLVVFVLKLHRLVKLVERLSDGRDAARADLKEVSALDQMLDVWIQVFVGIGVIWTAVGMRSALQAALGDPDGALTDSAGTVLRNLVDGGILLALTTTIVGAVGGYVMRLVKTAFVGAELHRLYDNAERAELRALLAAAERIEQRLTSDANVRHLPGADPARREREPA